MRWFPFNIFRNEQRIISAEFESAVNKALTADTVADATRRPFITEEGALNLSAVWACVRILSDTVGTMPIHLYKRTEKGRERQYSHQCHRLLQTPNSFSNRFDLIIHRRRGFNGIGYHYYIRKDGSVLNTRALERIGAHVRGYNAESIGICYEGGLDRRGRSADTRTPEQCASLQLLVHQLRERFPGCRVCGHRDLSPDLNGNGEIEPEEWIKACPCFEVKTEFSGK